MPPHEPNCEMYRRFPQFHLCRRGSGRAGPRGCRTKADSDLDTGLIVLKSSTCLGRKYRSVSQRLRGRVLRSGGRQGVAANPLAGHGIRTAGRVVQEVIRNGDWRWLLLLTEVSGCSEQPRVEVRIVFWLAWQAGQKAPGTPLENEFPRGKRNGVSKSSVVCCRRKAGEIGGSC